MKKAAALAAIVAVLFSLGSATVLDDFEDGDVTEWENVQLCSNLSCFSATTDSLSGTYSGKLSSNQSDTEQAVRSPRIGNRTVDIQYLFRGEEVTGDLNRPKQDVFSGNGTRVCRLSWEKDIDTIRFCDNNPVDVPGGGSADYFSVRWQFDFDSDNASLYLNNTFIVEKNFENSVDSVNYLELRDGNGVETRDTFYDNITYNYAPVIDDITVFNNTYQEKDRIEGVGNRTIHIQFNVTDKDDDVDTVLFNLTDPLGNKDIENLNPTAIDSVENGSTYEVNYTLPDNVDEGGRWKINISANDTNGSIRTNSSTFIYQLLDISEGDEEQGDAEIEEKTLFSEEDLIENPSDVEYKNVTAQVSIFTDTASQQDVDVFQPAGLKESSIDVNISAGTVEWVIESVSSSYSNTWDVEYNTTAISISTSNQTTTQDGENVWKKTLNMSNNETQINDVFSFSGIKDPLNTTSVELFEDGTEITNDADFSVQIASNLSSINWTVPSLDGYRNFTILASRGKTIKTDKETVIRNKPVLEAKSIQWRRCIQLTNPNDFSKTYSTKLRPPRGASNLVLEEGCSTDFPSDAPEENLLFDNRGGYVPVETDLGSDSNKTFGLWFRTSSISVSPPVRDIPDVFYVDEDADIDLDIDVLGESPIDIETDGQIQVDVPIDFGENVEVKQGGELIAEEGTVRNGLTFNFSNLSDSETKEFTFNYTIPTAESEIVMEGLSESGNNLSVYRVSSQAPQQLEDVRLFLDDLDHVFVENATRLERIGGQKYVLDEQLDWEGGRSKGFFEPEATEIKIGNLSSGVDAEPVFVGVEYRKVNSIVDMTKQELYEVLALWLGRGAFLLLLFGGGYLFSTRVI